MLKAHPTARIVALKTGYVFTADFVTHEDIKTLELLLHRKFLSHLYPKKKIPNLQSL